MEGFSRLSETGWGSQGGLLGMKDDCRNAQLATSAHAF